MKYDVIIIGAGPAGIFTAMELVKNGSTKKILLVEKGKAIKDRKCPKSKTKKCVNCKPCNITTGFSGAGAFSDGKLSLSYEVGGDFPTLVGEDFAQELIHYTDQSWSTVRSAIWEQKKHSIFTARLSSICWTKAWRCCLATTVPT